jgi:aspartate/methionine/tyrosine aminotransferase
MSSCSLRGATRSWNVPARSSGPTCRRSKSGSHRITKFSTTHQPQAGAIVTLRYRLPIASEALFNRLRKKQSVLITPGAHFGIGKYIRIGFGYEIKHTLRGLKKLDAPLAELRERKTKKDRKARA